MGKISAGELRKALEKLLAELKKKQKEVTKTIKAKNAEKVKKTPEIKRGRKTLKQLSQQNDGLSTVELKDPDLRLLNQTMKNIT